MIAPFVKKMTEEKNIPLIKIDVDESPELMQAYKVESMPTFLVVKGKWDNVIDRSKGASQEIVTKIFKKAA